MPSNGSPSQSPKIEDLIASINDTSDTTRNASTALLGVAITLAATILASSDEAILRDQLGNLFGIDVSVRLSIAYTLMPPVFLFLHINVLLQFHVLAERLEVFKHLLKSIYKDENDPQQAEERNRWRRQLHGFAFVQYSVNDEAFESELARFSDRIRNLLLWFVNQVSITLVPLTLLIAAQIGFLRYQSEEITLFHRIVVLIDLACIIWFQVARAQNEPTVKRTTRSAMPLGQSAVVQSATLPSDRPFLLLLGTTLTYLFFWLFGADMSLPTFLLVGALLGWLAGELSDNLERPLLWWALAFFFGLIAQALIGTLFTWNAAIYVLGLVIGPLVPDAVKFALGWSGAQFAKLGKKLTSGVAACLAPLRRAKPERSTNDGIGNANSSWLSAIIKRFYAGFGASSRVTNAPSPGYMVKRVFWLSPLPLFVVWLVTSEATVPSGQEPACQVRWDWTQAIAYAKETPDLSNPVADDMIQKLRTRWRLAADLIVGPVFFAADNPCLHLTLTSPPKAIFYGPNNSDSTGAPPNPADDRDLYLLGARANLFDRAFCPAWGIGCRYLNLLSSVLLSSSSSNLAESDDETAKRRAAGLVARDRNLRFARLEHAILIGADLRNADLPGADLSSADLSWALLSGATLVEANMSEAHLRSTDISAANLQLAKLTKADLQGTFAKDGLLQGAVLDGANLRGADFDDAELEGASLKKSVLDGASLDGATIIGAQLDRASLGAASLDQVQFLGVTTSETKFDGAFIALDTSEFPSACDDRTGEDAQRSMPPTDEIKKTVEAITGQLKKLKLRRAVLDQIKWEIQKNIKLVLSQNNGCPFNHASDTITAATDWAKAAARVACDSAAAAEAIVQKIEVRNESNNKITKSLLIVDTPRDTIAKAFLEQVAIQVHCVGLNPTQIDDLLYKYGLPLLKTVAQP